MGRNLSRARVRDHAAVTSLVPTRRNTMNLRVAPWRYTLVQREFGPRRLIVMFADRDGRLRGLIHTERTHPPEVALTRCLDRFRRRAVAAVAYCDEPVTAGPRPDGLDQRFARASELCASRGLHLVDWYACDDILIRSLRGSIEDDGGWWPFP